MSELFTNYEEFNDNISEWDVSIVTNMSCMFYFASSFNQDVSEWDVSNVTDMSHMFGGASSFNQDVSEWDVSNVTDMTCLFCSASSFNQDVSEWDVSNAARMSSMFYYASSFNQDVSKWDVSMLRDAEAIFSGAKVQVMLERYCNRKCFFDADCRAMSRIKRQEFFSVAFPWSRRKSFLLFLVSQRYLYYSSVNIVDCNRREEVCDVLFDVEDLNREICRFL